MRYRITLRADNLELRGYVDGDDTLKDLANLVRPIMVIASPATEDYNPFAVKPSPDLDTMREWAERGRKAQQAINDLGAGPPQ